MADMVLRPMLGEPSRPASDMFKLSTLGLAQEAKSPSSRYVTDLYAQAKVVEEAMNTWKDLQTKNKPAEAAAFFKANKADIVRFGSVEGIKRSLTTINNTIRMIERSAASPENKKARILVLREAESKIARRLAAHD
jgi:hypothetical protein